MKSIQLSLNNEDDDCWITFEKEDNLPYILPFGAKFETPNIVSLKNMDQFPVMGVVYGYCYRDEDSKFITKIKEKRLSGHLLKFEKEALLKNGWNIIFQDDNLMLKDKC